MKSYKSYVFKVLLCISLLFLITGGLTYIVDPYGVNWRFVRRGFNLNKGMFPKSVRLAKAHYVNCFKPETLLVGTSRVEYGLSPEDDFLRAYQPVYNYGLSSSNLYEQRRYIEYAVRHNKIKTIIMGLDLGSFGKMSNSPDFDEKRLESPSLIRKIRECYLSLSATYGIFRTIKKNTRNPDEVEICQNGWRSPEKQDRAVKEGRTTLKIECEKSEMDFLRIVYYRFSLMPERFNDFKMIADLCKKNNIAFYPFISPAHPRQWEVIHKTGSWDEWDKWKRTLVGITPVWDFSGYHDFNKQEKFYLDSSHYRKEMGHLVFERLIGPKKDSQNPDDFGVLLTLENIESHLQSIRKQHEKWVENNPGDVSDIDSLYRQTNKK